MRNLCLLALFGLLVACTGNGANHIGNPASLPLRGITTGIENTVYNARRKRVTAYVTANHTTILAEIEKGGGPALFHSYDLALVPTDSRSELTARLLDDRHIYFVKDPEPLIVALMVHGP